jgi:hypothetical protein
MKCFLLKPFAFHEIVKKFVIGPTLDKLGRFSRAYDEFLSNA